MSKKLVKSDEYAIAFNRLIDVCELRNTTVSALLDEFATSRSAITAWKKGNINTNVLAKIASKLDISLDMLLAGKEYGIRESGSPLENEMVEVFRQLTDTDKGQVLGFAKGIYNNYSAEIKETG